MLDVIGTQSRYFNEINISTCCKMPLTIISFGIVVVDPCLNPRMMATCSISSLVDGANSCSQTVQYLSVATCVPLSEWLPKEVLQHLKPRLLCNISDMTRQISCAETYIYWGARHGYQILRSPHSWHCENYSCRAQKWRHPYQNFSPAVPKLLTV